MDRTAIATHLLAAMLHNAYREPEKLVNQSVNLADQLIKALEDSASKPKVGRPAKDSQ
jgi:hypothetical protein